MKCFGPAPGRPVRVLAERQVYYTELSLDKTQASPLVTALIPPSQQMIGSLLHEVTAGPQHLRARGSHGTGKGSRH